MSGVFGGLFEHGTAFRGGRVVPFASGGPVSGPTFFPMAGGIGLMGERPPGEAVMPLVRTPDGSLSVRAEGGGGTNLYFTIQVDARGSTLLSASFILFSVGAATLSYLLLRGVGEGLKVAALAFVAGMLAVAAVEDMIEEATRRGRTRAARFSRSLAASRYSCSSRRGSRPRWAAARAGVREVRSSRIPRPARTVDLRLPRPRWSARLFPTRRSGVSTTPSLRRLSSSWWPYRPPGTIRIGWRAAVRS